MTAPIVRVSGLRVAYGTSAHHAVDGVDLEVAPGEIVSIVGESGSGKSTTVAALIGLLPEGARVHEGSIEVDGVDVVGLDEKALRRLLAGTVGYVPQDPTISLDPVQTVGSQIDEVFRLHGSVPRSAIRDASIAILRRVGIDRPEVRHGQYPHELSGGMRQRVLIGIALAGRPRLIVADEPTSGLDVTVQKTVLDELVALARDEGVAVVLVTHDLGVAHDRSQRIVVMQKGRIVEEGPAAGVFRSPAHPYTRRLIAAVPTLAHPVLRPPAREDPPAEPVLRAEGIRKTFRLSGARGARDLVAVDDISLAVGRGRTLGIVGESGSGKSTLARILAGLTEPTEGTVRLDGRDVAGAGRRERRELRRQVQYVYQNPFASLDPRFTVERVIAEPLTAFRVGDRATRRRRVAELLDLVALPSDVARRTPVALSGGQRQRVAIARALALEPRLLILDEPVSALDVSVQEQVLRLLVSVQEELGLTSVFISHDLAVVRLVSDEVLVVQGGRAVEAGRTQEIFDAPQHAYTRALLDAIPGPRDDVTRR
ncbi:ABC transporter ATP-binding protein [Microbacterium gilvum]|uniref:ABC transporter ATP-binding protein n=1 Tax=Microbacterium gilvum TaxID=1336204 RepID=A0ABP9AQM1_9MICO